jgi:hypothetical protein
MYGPRLSRKMSLVLEGPDRGDEMHPTVMGMIAIERTARLQAAGAQHKSRKSRRLRWAWRSPQAARIAHA